MNLGLLSKSSLQVWIINNLIYLSFIFTVVGLRIQLIVQLINQMSATNKLVENTLLMISQSKTIMIDTQQQRKRSTHLNTVATISRLPAFEPDDKTTRILYSKFLVKGVQPINSNIMFSKIKANFQKDEPIPLSKQTTHLSQKRIVTEQNINNKPLKPQQQSDRQLGVFQLQKSTYQPINKYNRPQTAFQRSQSLNTLNRPQSAAHNNSFKKLSRYNSVERLSQAKRNRSQTAITRASSAKNNKFEVLDEADKVWPILALTDQGNNLKCINYIEKNRREASIKKQHSYAPDIEKKTNNFIVPQKLIDKTTKAKEAKQQPIRQRFTIRQKQQIKQRHAKYLSYLKQNMPQQYKQCINYLSTLDQEGNRHQRSLFHSTFQQQSFEPSSKQLEQQQVQDYYQKFYNIIVDVQYGIKKTQLKQKYIEPSSAILNIYECEEITNLYKQIQLCRQSGQVCPSNKERLMQLLMNLQFFRHQKMQVLKNMLQMNYSIQSVPENTQIIRQDSPINNVYVILNGSVAKKNKQEDQGIIDFNTHLPQFFTTLFDGQIFGLPSKPKDKVLNYSIKTFQTCLLMTFPYGEYRKALSNNQNIEDRVQLLKMALSNEGNSKLGKEDLQIIAFQMQSVNFSAQQIVYREDQVRNSLIIIASGKVAICFQSILRRKKYQTNSLLKKRNQLLPQYTINQYRRKNLKNYQLIHQTSEEIIYYYFEIVQEKMRGDVLNWEGFYHSLRMLDTKGQYGNYCASYSVLSMQDNTTIYQLSPQKTQNFPSHIKASILNKAQSIKNIPLERDTNKINKWEQYKQNLVTTILNKRN